MIRIPGSALSVLYETAQQLRSSWAGVAAVAILFLFMASAIAALVVEPRDFPHKWATASWNHPVLAKPYWMSWFGAAAPTVSATVKPVDTVTKTPAQVFRTVYKTSVPPRGLDATIHVVVPETSDIVAAVELYLIRPDGVKVRLAGPDYYRLSDLNGATVKPAPAVYTGYASVLGIPPDRLRAEGIGLLFTKNGKPLKGKYIIELLVYYPYIDNATAKLLFSSLEAEATIHVYGDTCCLLGTDSRGRPIADGILYGSLGELVMAVLTAALAVAIGSVAGILAGYSEGLAGGLARGVVHALADIPAVAVLLIAGAAITVWLAGPWIKAVTLSLVMAALLWPVVAITVADATAAIKESDYILAAKAMGLRSRDIILLHILPGVLPVILSQLVYMIPYTVMIEAGLDILGIRHGLVTWGLILAQAVDYITSGGSVGVWWWWLPPGIAISLLSLSGILAERALSPRRR